MGRPLYFCPVVSSTFYLQCFSSPNLSRRRLDVYHTWCGLSVNLWCRLKYAARGSLKNTGRKKSPKIRHLRTIAEVCRAISSQLRQVSTIGKKLLSSNTSSTQPHNMVTFGPLVMAALWNRAGHYTFALWFLSFFFFLLLSFFFA